MTSIVYVDRGPLAWESWIVVAGALRMELVQDRDHQIKGQVASESAKVELRRPRACRTLLATQPGKRSLPATPTSTLRFKGRTAR